MSSINTALPEGRAPRTSHMMSANEGYELSINTLLKLIELTNLQSNGYHC